jgi:predicted Na+-dependent transporter
VLLANLVLVPALAFQLKAFIPMDAGFGVGLIPLATAAGAPFLPKLVQVAKSDVALSVGAMVLLMVTTVMQRPLVLPLLLPGVAVDPLAIATSLVVSMVMPLAIGLFIKATPLWDWAQRSGTLLPRLWWRAAIMMIPTCW